MKQITLFLLTFYQQYISILLRQLVGTNTVCRYSPTCSEYAKMVVEKHGFVKGVSLAAIRILSCQPWVTVTRVSSV